MVNAAERLGIDPADGRPERALAFGYAPAGQRDGLQALFALDAMLARLTRRTREPIVAQMRLAWWREALDDLEAGPVGGQPILAALRPLSASGVAGAALAGVVDGWEALLTGDIDAYARGRGRTLFEAAARVLGAADAWVGDAGEGWALADLARNTPDASTAAAARDRAGALLGGRRPRASRAARPLGALALSARMDLAGQPEGSPARVARLLRFRLFGR